MAGILGGQLNNGASETMSGCSKLGQQCQLVAPTRLHAIMSNSEVGITPDMLLGTKPLSFSSSCSPSTHCSNVLALAPCRTATRPQGGVPIARLCSDSSDQTRPRQILLPRSEPVWATPGRPGQGGPSGFGALRCAAHPHSLATWRYINNHNLFLYFSLFLFLIYIYNFILIRYPCHQLALHVRSQATT